MLTTLRVLFVVIKLHGAFLENFGDDFFNFIKTKTKGTQLSPFCFKNKFILQKLIAFAPFNFCNVFFYRLFFFFFTDQQNIFGIHYNKIIKPL